MRLGIYGGTFSPPHIGHIEAARAFCKEMQLDRLLIIPAFIPPHKDISDTASPLDRLQMCRLAFSDIPNCHVSDIEISRGGKSYTYLTLEELRSDRTELFLLCGTDMLLTFDQWKRYEYIFSLAEICYVRRECDDEISLKLEEKIRQYRKLGANIVEISHNVTEISSSEIRESLDDGRDNEFLTSEVLNYIKDNGLYFPTFSKEELSSLRQEVKKLMSDRRFSHTLGVEAAAGHIAEYVAPSLITRAMAAALLHDVTKEMPVDIEDGTLNLTDDDRIAPETLHALTAPRYIAEHFPRFAAPDILFAVETHTVGDPRMSTLGKIIFVADYVEEGRTYESCHALREKLYYELSETKSRAEALEALDRAVISSIDLTSAHLINTGKKPHFKTSLTRDAISNTKGQKYGN